MILKLRRGSLDLRTPRVMGILNCTPDSFSDGGRYPDLDSMLRQVEQMLGAGADLIDVGGESTRPGAASVPEDEELLRVLPVIEAVVKRFDCIVSVDTAKPAVMRAAVDAGAQLINDVNALRAPGALDVARESGAAVCLMHMSGMPRTMQNAPVYDDVIVAVSDFLAERIQSCVVAGISRDRLCIDPGFGFGKTLQHNLSLLDGLGFFRQFGLPLLIGMSRKSMLAPLSGDRGPNERLAAGLAATALAVANGARIVRTHDVAPTVEAVRFTHSVMQTERRRG